MGDQQQEKSSGSGPQTLPPLGLVRVPGCLSGRCHMVDGMGEFLRGILPSARRMHARTGATRAVRVLSCKHPSLPRSLCAELPLLASGRLPEHRAAFWPRFPDGQKCLWGDRQWGGAGGGAWVPSGL